MYNEFALTNSHLLLILFSIEYIYRTTKVKKTFGFDGLKAGFCLPKVGVSTESILSTTWPCVTGDGNLVWYRPIN